MSAVTGEPSRTDAVTVPIVFEVSVFANAPDHVPT